MEKLLLKVNAISVSFCENQKQAECPARSPALISSVLAFLPTDFALLPSLRLRPKGPSLESPFSFLWAATLPLCPADHTTSLLHDFSPWGLQLSLPKSRIRPTGQRVFLDKSLKYFKGILKKIRKNKSKTTQQNNTNKPIRFLLIFFFFW